MFMSLKSDLQTPEAQEFFKTNSETHRIECFRWNEEFDYLGKTKKGWIILVSASVSHPRGIRPWAHARGWRG